LNQPSGSGVETIWVSSLWANETRRGKKEAQSVINVYLQKTTCLKGKLMEGGGSNDDPSQKKRHHPLREGQVLAVVFINIYPWNIGLGVADVAVQT
jgi:hypothetical protein